MHHKVSQECTSEVAAAQPCTVELRYRGGQARLTFMALSQHAEAQRRCSHRPQRQQTSNNSNTGVIEFTRTNGTYLYMFAIATTPPIKNFVLPPALLRVLATEQIDVESRSNRDKSGLGAYL